MSPVKYSITLLVAALAAPQASANVDANLPAAPQIGELKTYKDWTVGCDNGGVCEAMSLIPMDGGDDYKNYSGIVSVQRSAEPDGNLTIRVLLEKQGFDRYQMMIDGRLVDTGPVNEENYSIEIVGEDARKVSHEIAKGNILKLFGPDNEKIAQTSLAGSAAALRYMDDVQNRKGTATALVADGRRKFQPIEAKLPTVTVDRWAASQRVPETQDIVELVEQSECSDHRFGLSEEQAYPLGVRNGEYRALVLVSCGAGAYNFASAAYIGVLNARDASAKTGQDSVDSAEGAATWTFRPANFDLDLSLPETKDLPILTNASWDDKDQILSSYNKGRGLADCGQARQYVWDGNMFRLIEASRMDECRGSLNWITTWRARFVVPEPASEQVAELEKSKPKQN